MAEAAAHAAAMQAFQDAMRQGVDDSLQHDKHSYNIGTGSNGIVSMLHGSDGHSEMFDSEEMRLMASLDLNNLDNSQANMLNGWMGFQQATSVQTTDDSTANELLRLIEQQQQQQLEQEHLLHEISQHNALHEAQTKRPQKHYFTIAQNGEYLFIFLLLL